MINFFKKDKDSNKNDISAISLTSLLVHAAKIDENYADEEREIIKNTLIKLGIKNEDVPSLIKKAEEEENNSNQILEYTKEAKNLVEEKKLILLEALWTIIYSDKNVDMYEANLMRRLSGLLYLDKKVVGDIKEKIKNKKK